MNIKYLIVLSIVIFFSSVIAFSQQLICGSVEDFKGNFLPGAFVFLKEHDSIVSYCQADFDGSFVLFSNVKNGMYIETHFMDEIKRDSLALPIEKIVITLKSSQKTSVKQLYLWQQNMILKYNLQYKEE